jgi:hypothetical protein
VTTQSNSAAEQKPRRKEGELEQRYGAIGISAVAAAVKLLRREPARQPDSSRFDRYSDSMSDTAA